MKQDKLTSLGLLLLRLALGIPLSFYGMQLLFGIFGGSGFASSVHSFEVKTHLPMLVSSLAVFSIFLGGIGVLCGLLTRISASLLALVLAYGVYLKFPGVQVFSAVFRGQTFGITNLAPQLLLLVIALALACLGGGAYSLDGKLFKGGKRR